jgi:phi LC3 family holin
VLNKIKEVISLDIKSRLRNKAFILSVVAFIVLIVKTFTKFELPDNFDFIVNSALTILTGLGVIIDPTTSGVTDGKSEAPVETK